MSPSPSMNIRHYATEVLGTFVLTLAVLLSIAYPSSIVTPFVAAATLGLFVYTVGGISGAHFNPSVTLGLLSVNRIKADQALLYVISQLLGAIIAMLVAHAMGVNVTVGHDDSLSVGIAEAMGAFLLVFGVSSVVWKNVQPVVSGLVIGLSLFIGIIVAMPFSNGVLNPAVALGIGSFGPMYILGPLVGGVAGAWAFAWLSGQKNVLK